MTDLYKIIISLSTEKGSAVRFVSEGYMNNVMDAKSKLEIYVLITRSLSTYLLYNSYNSGLCASFIEGCSLWVLGQKLRTGP